MAVAEVFRSAIDFLRLLEIAGKVEKGRRRGEPARLIASMRARGSVRKARDEAGRRRLQRVIRFVDGWFPSGSNCFRRVLMEIAVDANAAREPIHLGLRAHGGRNSGHAWLSPEVSAQTTYDAEFTL